MHHPVTLNLALDWLFNLHEPNKAAMLAKALLEECARRLDGTTGLGIFTVFLPFGSGGNPDCYAVPVSLRVEDVEAARARVRGSLARTPTVIPVGIKEQPKLLVGVNGKEVMTILPGQDGRSLVLSL